jgi:hypothetical protein
MRLALLRLGFDWVAQPTTKQTLAAATVRLRHFGIGNISPSITGEPAKGKQ